jgi:hypothetical protein
VLRYYYINREWIVSATARRFYCLTAWLSVVLFVLLVLLSVDLQIAGKIPGVLVPATKLFLFSGVLGAATTMVAMEYFLFGFDTSPAWKKALWFCIMLLPPIGPPLYCFVVYSRSEVLKESVCGNAQKASA